MTLNRIVFLFCWRLHDEHRREDDVRVRSPSPPRVAVAVMAAWAAVLAAVVSSAVAAGALSGATGWRSAPGADIQLAGPMSAAPGDALRPPAALPAQAPAA